MRDAANAAEEKARQLVRNRALKAKQRHAEKGSAGAYVHRVKYGAGETAPTIALVVGDAVLLRDCPAPGYACWAVVTRLEMEGPVVIRDLTRNVLRYTPPLRDHNGNATSNHAATSKAGTGGKGGGQAALRAPEGYWAENLCLPLRCGGSGWGLPMMGTEEVLFALPADDYSELDFDAERPPDYTSYERYLASGAAAGEEADLEPHARMLVAARREITMWATTADDLGQALAALWPELQRGFGLIPGRARKELPSWEQSFLAIPDVGSRSPSRSTSGAASPFFSSEDTPFVVPLI